MYRPCKFFTSSNVSAAWRIGLFHQWAVVSTESIDGHIAETVALIEDCDGSVWSIQPSNMQFTDRAFTIKEPK